MNPAFSGKRSYALVEPPLLLYIFGRRLTVDAKYSLVQLRSSDYIWRNDHSEQLHANGSIVDTFYEVYDYAEKIRMYQSFVDVLVPAILMFFLGSWSDSYGRKPLLVAAYAGSAISFLLWSVLSSVGPFDPIMFLVASVPTALVGGYCTVILATYSYITDIRQQSDRGWHFTWLQSVISIGQVSAYIAIFEIQDRYGHTTIFVIASVANLIATIYVLFFVPESVTRRVAKRPWPCLLDPWSIKDMFATCVRKRDGFDRVLIWCCVCALAINVLIEQGDISYFIASVKFDWTILDNFRYSLTVGLLIVAGTILGGLICKALIDRTMANMSIAVLANASALIGSLAKAFATQSWHFYLSAFLGILGGLSGPVIRNALSKSAPPQEVGKVFSLMTSMEAIMTLVALRLSTMLYSHYPDYSLHVYPLLASLVSVGLYASIIFIALMIKWRISKLFKLKNPPITPPSTVVDPEMN